MRSWRWNKGGELFNELAWGKKKVRRAVTPGRFEAKLHLAVFLELYALV